MQPIGLLFRIEAKEVFMAYENSKDFKVQSAEAESATIIGMLTLG